MSIFSTAASKPPPEATVASNGYRSIHTRSIGPMPCSVMAAAWAGASRTPSRPPCTTGCSVLTLPSIISGKPVSSATSRTARPSFSMAARVPPVETSSTPSSASWRAAASRPVLSDREISARTGRTASGEGGKSGAAGMARLLARTLDRVTCGGLRAASVPLGGPRRAELPAHLGLGVGAGRAAGDQLQRAAGQAFLDVDRGFDRYVRGVGSEPPASTAGPAQQDGVAVAGQGGDDPRLEVEAQGVGGGQRPRQAARTRGRQRGWIQPLFGAQL